MDRKAWVSQRHTRIMAAARAIFGRGGFDQARIDDIASAAEVSKGSVYYHFKDKEDLFSHLVEEVITDDLRSARADFPPQASALQRLDFLLDVLLNRVVLACEGDNLMFEIWASAAKRRSGIFRSLTTAHQRWHDAIKGILDDGHDRGEFGAGIDTQAAACLIMAAVSGVIVNWRFGGQDDPARLDKLRHGLLLAVSAW
jgi:AcrR family transcriptional regulator